MRIQADCLPCLMKRMLFQTRLVGAADERGIMGICLRSLSDAYSPELRSVDVASDVHRDCYDALGSDDPYLELKERSDAIAAGLVPAAEQMVSGSDDPLRTALGVCAAGNIMDFGPGIAIDDPSEFLELFSELAGQGFGKDDTEVLRDLLLNEGPVVYIFDNCGECQLDRVLIRLLRSQGKRVVGVVRELPILNDVSLRDVERTGIGDDLDAVYGTGRFFVGVDMASIPEGLRREMEGACVIIAKGMGNYESLSDDILSAPIVHVLRAKCLPVASSIGVPVGTNVVLARMPGE